ncbi:MAG: hypothetical protein HY691_20405 [Chloroflexi bacterium]|nr:hypothetical protein [Chloroflexota bacterium]
MHLVLAATHGTLAANQTVLDFRLLFASEDGDELTDLSTLEIYEGKLRLHQAFQVTLTACHLGET